MQVAKPVVLSAEGDRRLRDLSNRKHVRARVQLRARIVRLAAVGVPDKDIADKLDTDRRAAAPWRARFLQAGLDSLLKEATRLGRPRTARETANVEEVVSRDSERAPGARAPWPSTSERMPLRGAHLARPPPQASPHQDLQTL